MNQLERAEVEQLQRDYDEFSRHVAMLAGTEPVAGRAASLRAHFDELGRRLEMLQAAHATDLARERVRYIANAVDHAYEQSVLGPLESEFDA